MSAVPVPPAGNQPPRSFLARAWGRLRHGLLLQELLDRLAAAGLVCYPYFIASESLDTPTTDDESSGLAIRPLGADDVDAILNAGGGRRDESTVRARFPDCLCVGAFDGPLLAGYTWAAFDAVPVVHSTAVPLFRLAGNDAYLFEMFVTPRYRGKRLAGELRRALQREVAKRGRRNLYSVTLAFNRSSRRFKSRLGARDVELRVYLHLAPRLLPGIDVRLWRRNPRPPTPAVRRVPPQPRDRSAAHG